MKHVLVIELRASKARVPKDILLNVVIYIYIIYDILYIISYISYIRYWILDIRYWLLDIILYILYVVYDL